MAVVLPTKDRPAFLERALEELCRNLRPGDQLVVVDSASRDPSAIRIAESAGARLVRLEVPGLARARNAGVAVTTAPIVAFTDDDCVIGPDWRARVERAFDEPSTGFVVGRTMGDRPTSLSASLVVGETRRRFEGPTDPLGIGGGGNSAVRRVAFDQIGGFDEELGVGAPLRSAEDHDAFWRLLCAGWSGMYDPAMGATHVQWRSMGEAIRKEFTYGLGSGAFAVKVIRSRHPDGWRMLRTRLWRHGLALSGRNLMLRYKSGTVGALAKTAGVVAGAVVGATLPIEDGRFRAKVQSRTRRRSSE